MKTYKQLMEVMSMSDMNKITGGTEAQRKIAQDRQRRREAKNKGFNPDKDVLADMSSVKKPAAATKASAEKDPLKQAHSKAMAKSTGLAKTGQKALPPSDKGGDIEKRKPDLRKSQLGKWSQGIKSNPSATKKGGAMVKAQNNKPAAPEVQKADVKVLKKDGMQGQQGSNPGTARPMTPQEKKQEQERKKRKMNLGKHLKKVGSGAKAGLGKLKDAALKANPEGVGVSGEGSHGGVQQRNKGLAN